MRVIFSVLFILCVQLVGWGYPFEFETCDLGYTHVHHKHNEASYQQAWSKAHDGVMEYENRDFTRVDCLTDTHAVEFDFANKWHEAIGQALHYGVMTGKRPMVVLILDEPDTQMVYFKRVKKIAKKYNFDVEYVTNDILNLDKNGECQNPECKCHKRDMQHSETQPTIHFVV